MACLGAVGDKVSKGRMTYVVAKEQVEILVQMRSDNPQKTARKFLKSTVFII